ncbi:ABC transporter permease [Streptomyces sp. NPDC092369]|uniref:ABC transporter permease n=1 Tax=Streptomyces sp. NPDC092369 TaxID=3366015 RepID=UPI00381564FB
MSAVLTHETPVAVRTPGPRRTWAAVIALTLFEARRLLLRIPVLVAFAAYIGWTVWRAPDFEDGFPALQDVDRATQAAPLLVALAVLLSVNHAVLRSQRYDTERHFQVLVLAPGWRTAAHALSVVAAALVTGLVVLGQFGWAALQPGAVGGGSPGELLVGPLTVLLFGAIGVLEARLLPSAMAAPLAIVLLLFLFVAGAFPAGGGERGTRWLAPIVSESSSTTLPSDLIGRPAAWHALYLAGVALTVALLAVLVAGRNRLVGVAAAGALALTVTGGVAQTADLPARIKTAREQATNAPEKTQKCVEREGSTYCAFPDWTARTATWAKAADRVRSLAGGTAHDQPLVVRQRIEARYGLQADGAIAPATAPHQVTVGTAWGGNRVPEFSVAVAGVLVAGDEKAASSLCGGRMVTVMWLALAGQDDPLRSMRDVRLDDSVTGSAIVVSQTEPLSMGAAQTTVVRELLGKPRETVAAQVKAHWAELTSPELTSARAAELLGVPAPKEKDEKCES